MFQFSFLPPNSSSPAPTKMDKYLRPERFDVEPTSSSADKEWTHWKKTFENFLSHVKDAKAEDKLQLLTNYIAPNVFTLLDGNTTYDAAIQALETLYVKPKNVIYARHCLASRQQNAGETVDQYLQALEQLSKDCKFTSVSAIEHKNEYIRDTFIGGLSSSHIRQRLLENTTLTLEQAFDQARSLELAQHHSATYVTQASYTEVASTQPHTDTVASSSGKPCFFCGKSWHSRTACPAKEAECTNCNKLGHYARVCRSKKQLRKTTATTNHDYTAIINKKIEPATTAASPNSLNKSITPIRVNDILLNGLVDTGSSLSFINEALVKKCRLKILPYEGSISMANSSLCTQIKGQCKVDLKVAEHSYNNIYLLIMKNLCSDVIIGHDVLNNHSTLEIAFDGSNPPLKICNLATLKVKPVSLFTNLTENCKPIITKSRKYSKEDSEFIDTEIEKLLEEEIIEPSNSSWRAQAFVVRDGRHKPRMVIDYSRTINQFTQLDAYPLPRIDVIISKVSQNEVFSVIDLKSAYHQVPILDSEKQFTAFEAAGKLYHFRRIPFGVTNGVAAFQRTIDYIVEAESLEKTYPYLDDVTICGKTIEEHNKNLEKFFSAVEKYDLTINKEKSKFSMKSISLLGYTISNKTIKPDAERLKPLLELPLPHDVSALQRAIGMFSYYSKWIPKFSEKIKPLLQVKPPLNYEAINMFKSLKEEICRASTGAIVDEAPFTVETDASQFAIAATLSQMGRPVAFFSRTLNKAEQNHSSIEKEAYAIVESVRHWRHYLMGKPFKVITDQKSVSFMFEQKHNSKIKNEKIMRWRLELSCYKFDIVYRPGKENAPADTLSRITASINSKPNLKEIHNSLCHPGITRMVHWIRAKNLPFSVEEIKEMIEACDTCSQLKPRFFKHQGQLIKATSPFERLNLDFKGPLPTNSRNKYILTVVDEYSRFPFAFPCADVTSQTVIKHLQSIIKMFGIPAYIHSDRGAAFMSAELKSFLTQNGIATSRTTPYNPRGNGQCERYNGIIWKTVMLALKTRNMNTNQWEIVIDSALHAIRSLLCTATNETPHERMFNHPRRTYYGNSMPAWLTKPGPVLLKKFNQKSKYDPLVDEVELLEANLEYAHVRLPDGRETTVSTRNLAPAGEKENAISNQEDIEVQTPEVVANEEAEIGEQEVLPPIEERIIQTPERNIQDAPARPRRERRRPIYLQDYITDF